MNHNRRAFLRSSSLAVIAALTPQFGFAAVAPVRAGRIAPSVPFSAADEAVLQWVASYSTDARVLGAAILGRLRGKQMTTRIVARIADTAALEAVLAAPLPFTDVYSKGNVIAFTFDGARYEVENLLSPLFVAKLTKLTKQVIFGHEALTYNPATQKLSDPFKVLTSETLKIVRGGSGVAGAFENILRAWVEADQLELKLGPSFSRLKKRVMNAPGTRAALARHVVSALVSRLPQLTDLLTTEKIMELLQSRLIRTAISRILGVNAASVLAQFEVLLAASGADADADAVAWLASLLSEQLQQGIMPDWFGGLDAVHAQRARAALSRAYWLVRESSQQSISIN